MSDETTVRGVLENIAGELRALRRVQFQRQVAAETGPAEQVLVRYSFGTGTVRHGIDGRSFFIVQGKLVDLAGNDDGEFEAAWQTKVFTPQDLVSYPPPPPPPFDRPLKPGEAGWEPALNPTKSRWALRQPAGEIYAVGPALSRIVMASPSGPTQWFYSVAGFVTGGTRAFAGVKGQATSLGSGYFATVPALEEGYSFEVNAVHVLKLARFD